MCGVIGYIGTNATPEFFYNGLKRLEYRGYDSAGIAMMNSDGVFIQRAEGKLNNLQKKLSKLPENTKIGIGHTRWATHGKPTENNAHPHRSENIILLHNGIIENYKPLKTFLIKKGYEFQSETDTEVAAHLLNYEYKQLSQEKNNFERMKKAIFSLVSQIHGAFAFGIMCTDVSDTLYVVKYGSPVVLGLGKNENYMASGITALVEHTRSIIIMEDKEIAFLKSDKIILTDFSGNEIERKPIQISWSTAMLDKNGYDHYMLKEIHEQPQAVAQTINGRLDLELGKINIDNYGISNINLKEIDRIQIIACGTSFYAGSLARYFIEKFTKIPVEVELASESRYRTSTVNSRTLSIAVSQSGETIDTLQAIKFSKENGAQTLAIVNVPGSTIAHNCHDESLIYAGPEVGVASTKAFSAQVSSLIILGLALAQEQKKLSSEKITECIDELVKVPSLLEKTLTLSSYIEKISKKFYKASSILFIGRGQQWFVAMEGALKLKELSYIHAEGYAAGELKHGPIALIDENLWVVCLAPKDSYYEKTISNIEEIRARGGKILSVGTEGDEDLKSISDEFIGVVECSEIILPFLTAVPMHLLSYWIAVKKGTDVDQPRNLAKSVTVE
ncbi:glutamine--fructose-6-phosphate transaminase (isomerizing) [Fluviispira multicolorata]|uniref:Glutamine--fructose-6-phosphate aminotransferase [isomerizing] n=1 Tax=Fluviispira multicolorata TaxID=2654512 RepID=A0A833JFF0_9BACT|nr:glutamine--fructose-6-phosphate transaminase (isomerizing) [Fluviispira multicolorata]KAB8030894.1 glutamine--fructose-6-phosphate transaminase (isomerizing) [Fluviispira multicolorata]